MTVLAIISGADLQTFPATFLTDDDDEAGVFETLMIAEIPEVGTFNRVTIRANSTGEELAVYYELPSK